MFAAAVRAASGLSVCLAACLPVCLPACLHACLPACLPVCLSVFLSVCLSVRLSFFNHSFVRVFAHLFSDCHFLSSFVCSERFEKTNTNVEQFGKPAERSLLDAINCSG